MAGGYDEEDAPANTPSAKVSIYLPIHGACVAITHPPSHLTFFLLLTHTTPLPCINT